MHMNVWSIIGACLWSGLFFFAAGMLFARFLIVRKPSQVGLTRAAQSKQGGE